jgi:hypothetical protein
MEIDLGNELGAREAPFAQRLALYIPDRDCDGEPIADHEQWTTEAQELLTDIGGGASAFPPVDGTWRKPDGDDIWEQTKIIYTYADPDKLSANLSKLRSFLHRFGRETNQGVVVVEFDGLFWTIDTYDSPEGEEA